MSARTSLKAMILLIVLVALLPFTSFGEETGGIQVIRVKTLLRVYDPVVISGTMIPRLEGAALASLRVFSAGQGDFKVIPFQIDERTPEGQVVLPLGPKANQDDDSGLFDYNDELVFMAKDAGDQVAVSSLPDDGGDWVEVEVADPLRPSEKAWIYIGFFSADAPALSTVDYVHYQAENETITSDQYKLAYRPGYALYSDLSYPSRSQTGGYFGEDFMDRIKVRIQVKLMFNLFKIRKCEDDFKARVVAWKDGPIRVLRNVETYVRILFNISSPSVFAVTEFYPYHMYTPLRVTIPFDLSWVFNKFGISDWTWNFYGDLPGLEGGIMYSNRNAVGNRATPAMTQEWIRENIDQRYLVWGYATKEKVGTWFCNLVIPDAIYQYANLYLNIDEDNAYPPEDVVGEYGAGLSIGFHYIDKELWYMLSKGMVELGMETFFPKAGFKPEGVEEWRQIRQFPLMVSSPAHAEIKRDHTEKAKADMAVQSDAATPTENPQARLTDVNGRQFLLYNLQFHIGSIEATPKPWIIGEDIEKKKWHRVFFSDIKSLETYYKDVDPLTGMTHPVFHRIKLKTGEVLDLMTCKPCTFGGYFPDGRKAGFWVSQIKTVEFINAASQ